MIVEVTRMPIYNNALGLVPTQYFLLFKYLIPTLFSFFPFVFCFSFYLPPFLLPFFTFVLLTSPFFFPSFFFLFFFFFFSLFYPLLFLFLFLCLLFMNMEGQLYWHRGLLENSPFEWLKISVPKRTHPLIVRTH